MTHLLNKLLRRAINILNPLQLAYVTMLVLLFVIAKTRNMENIQVNNDLFSLV